MVRQNVLRFWTLFTEKRDIEKTRIFLISLFYYFLPATKVSKVSIAITFKRRWGYHFIQIYLPCIFLVFLSWLAFVMESSDIADRLALEVTMILSIVFLLGGVNTSLPHVSYAKASDWFIIVSFAFVFTALLETMLVYRLTSLDTSSQKQRNCLVRFLQAVFLVFVFRCLVVCHICHIRIDRTEKDGDLVNIVSYRIIGRMEDRALKRLCLVGRKLLYT